MAINWVKRQGLTVLFGAREEGRVQENLKGVSGEFELREDEFDRLEECRRRLKVQGTRNVFMTD